MSTPKGKAKRDIGLPINMGDSPRGQVELVQGAEHFRRVVRDGILTARTGIAIATADFKSMLVPTPGRQRAPSILDELVRLARRGVETRLLHSGVPSAPVLQRLRKAAPTGVVIRRCPRIHMKIVVIDCERMYLGSANLTGAGLGAKADHRRNFELGVWTTSSALIEASLDQFDAIWEGRYCEGCGRRDVCPEPLEEPDLAA